MHRLADQRRLEFDVEKEMSKRNTYFGMDTFGGPVWLGTSKHFKTIIEDREIEPTLCKCGSEAELIWDKNNNKWMWQCKKCAKLWRPEC